MALPTNASPTPVGKLPDTPIAVPLGRTRGQAMQRLQVGVAGVLGIVMLIGLVSIVESRAKQTESTAVPQAASTSEPGGQPAQADPLVEAGVVPDLTASPVPTATASAPILPEQGDVGARELAAPVGD